MTEAPFANLEMAILLPLGVAANQLMKIEADLRLLNMKVLDFALEREDKRAAARIEARLDTLNAALYSIRELVSELEDQIRPRPAKDDARSSPDAIYSHANRKPYPDRDD
jgi:hypothetical protein